MQRSEHAAGGGGGRGLAQAGLVLAALCWAGNTVLARAMHAQFPPVGLAFWRWCVAAALMLVLFRRRLWQARHRAWRHGRYLLALGCSGMFAFHTLQYWALHHTTASDASVIVATAPSLIAVVDRALSGASIRPLTAMSIALSLLGVGCVVLGGGQQELAFAERALGDGVMWLATWSWALYSVLLRRRPAELDAITVLCGTMLAALLFLFPLYLWEHAAGSRIPVDLVSVAVIGYVSCAAGIGGFLLFNQGVARVGPVVSNLFLNLIPVFALILAVLLLGERLAWLQAVGAALVMASVAAGARDVPRERPTRAELVST